MFTNKKGFTLIEMLVVVLIIGILAAIALPQYKHVIDKTRIANLVTIGESIRQAEDRYYLVNGQYTNDLQLLDVDFVASGADGYFYNNDWTAELRTSWLALRNNNIQDVRLYFVFDTRTAVYCYAITTNNKAKELCKRISEGYPWIDGAWTVYALK